MDFELTREQREIQRLAHEFAEKEIRPKAAYYDETEEFPWEIVKKAHKIGLTTFSYPEEYGGGGIDDPVTSLLVSEELAWGCAGIAVAVSGSHLPAAAIMAMGTTRQKKKWLPILCDPDNCKIGAMGLTEPGAGSDVSSIQTTARREGDHYVLNGTKQFITNGGIADIHVVFASLDRSKGWGGVAAFIIDDKNIPGFSMGRKERKMGVRASHTAQVIMEDVRIPVENRLGGEPGDQEYVPGYIGALKMLEHTRPGVASSAIGIARAAYEYALGYAKERIQFGKPIVEHQAVAFKLADMATRIDAARLLTWRAGWMRHKGVRFQRGEGSMAKLFAGDVAMATTIDAIQILGGYGYVKEYPVEKWARDAKIYQIWEGTAEIQRMVISRAIAKYGR
ncbi:acyl-CoA dehydrogenase family protein [Thermoactinomyces mirandus]|uniref:Acyl-CoA dehydrogenase family protein n=1 Tax=Thermoactinomyces mirandus TaxID=2756294 RepID=A0A7W1XUE1_9BACL|nr:acyl-CoA dehydrogenase family protein [Thermoactinomyces mirandus]MBA4603405.1 acyl-CoA dehydrogenase family protein [Thermoactinomyces mirandus]